MKHFSEEEAEDFEMTGMMPEMKRIVMIVHGKDKDKKPGMIKKKDKKGKMIEKKAEPKDIIEAAEALLEQIEKNF